MVHKNPSVDGFLRKQKQWRDELAELRRIALECDLTEEIKWRHPCYTLDNKNIIMMGGFNECFSLSFFKGALLKDEKNILEAAGPNTQSARVIRFTSLAQVKKLEPTLKKYIKEAIKLEQAGAKVEFKKIEERPIPDELKAAFKEMAELKTAFKALTPGRQREYIIHFSDAKQSKTRESRIEKAMDKIFAGEGLHDEYKKSAPSRKKKR